MTPRVRPATSRDFQALAALFAEVDALHIENHPERFRSPGTPPRTRDYLEQVLASPHQAFLVAELVGQPARSAAAASVDGRVGGLVHVAVYDAPAVPLFVPRLTAVVSDLVVARDLRGRGIGRRLMAEAESWARLHGASAIELSVYEFNRSARRFYEAAGYGTLSRMMYKQLG